MVVSKVKTEDEAKAGAELKAGIVGTLTDAAPTNGVKEVTSLEDFFSDIDTPYEYAVIDGRGYHFEGLSPQAKDALIAKHSKDDGMGNTSVDQTMWRTDVIALTWVDRRGGDRILNTEQKAHAFFTRKGIAPLEAKMYEVASRVAGLGDAETRRKNSANGGGTATSPTSPSTTSTLFPESSSQS